MTGWWRWWCAFEKKSHENDETNQFVFFQVGEDAEPSSQLLVREGTKEKKRKRRGRFVRVNRRRRRRGGRLSRTEKKNAEEIPVSICEIKETRETETFF